MRWDDATFQGEHGEWKWFVCRNVIENLPLLVIQEHPICRLWIATFDSGTITPSVKELAIGWSSIDGAMVSPPLRPGLDIPSDQFDEWYIFYADRLVLGELERFVNYGGFNLADPRRMAKSFDPTWEPSGLDWLCALQDRFWLQLDRLAPVSYVASGDNDVVVTRNLRFAECIRKAIR
jgi:hypothetical protein